MKLYLGYLLPVIILFAMHLSVLQYHENSHQAIMKYHGCEESYVEYNFLGAVTYCNSYAERSDEVRMQEDYLHGLADVIGYHMLAFVLVMILFLMLYFIIKDG